MVSREVWDFEIGRSIRLTLIFRKNILINIKKTKFDPNIHLYIGRNNKWLDLLESKWHNPFVLKKEKDRLLILKKHLDYVLNNPDLIDKLYELDGKILACYCFPRLCHGNTLIELRKLQKEGFVIDANLIEKLPVDHFFNDFMK